MRVSEQAISDESTDTMAVPAQEGLDIVLSFDISTDHRRILYALSIPEYMEAWLQAPAAEELLVFFDAGSQGSLLIDLYSAETLQEKIYVQISVLNANRIRYSWRTTSFNHAAETEVDMQLDGGPDGGTLFVKHSGLHDSRQRAWYRDMWLQSMDRLCMCLAAR